jgi:hypothetical protein
MRSVPLCSSGQGHFLRTSPEMSGISRISGDSAQNIKTQNNHLRCVEFALTRVKIRFLPRGVTVTQRPLEALFMVRIHAR